MAFLLPRNQPPKSMGDILILKAAVNYSWQSFIVLLIGHNIAQRSHKKAISRWQYIVFDDGQSLMEILNNIYFIKVEIPHSEK